MAQNKQKPSLERMDLRNVSIAAVILMTLCTLIGAVLGFDFLLGIAWAAAMISIAFFWGAVFWLIHHPESYPWGAAIPQRASAQLIGSLLLSVGAVGLARSGIFSLSPTLFALIQFALLALTSLQVLMLGGASRRIDEQQQAVKPKVAGIRDLESDLLSLASLAKEAELSAKLKALAQEVRFSDPMSDESLAGLERQLIEKTGVLRQAVLQEKNEEAARLTEEAALLLQERNQKCLIRK